MCIFSHRKNIPGFDPELAFEAISKNAFVDPRDSPPAHVGRSVEGKALNTVGRSCLSAYLKFGYVPNGGDMSSGEGEICHETVSRSLNYHHADWAIAQAARALGKTTVAEVLDARAANYSKLFDAHTGFFRSRESSGVWSG